MVEGALITGGICLSYWLDFGFSYLDPSPIAWRFPIAFQIVFALVILAFIMELPESPRWLILKGKEDEALVVLGALSDLPYDDPYIHGEFSAIKDTVIEMSRGTFADLFTMDHNRHLHRTVLAYVNQVFQQVSAFVVLCKRQRDATYGINQRPDIGDQPHHVLRSYDIPDTDWFEWFHGSYSGCCKWNR